MVWTETVLPHWPRRRRILEADVVARAGQLSRGGWAAALDDMRQGMRWLGAGRLQINTYDYPPREVTGARLLFVPVTRHRGWVAWDGARRFAVIYPCSGVLAAPEHVLVPEALARLVGPGRANVLALLETAKSTTQLVALTGQGSARSAATSRCSSTPGWCTAAAPAVRSSTTAPKPARQWCVPR